jgi:adenylate cyclase
MDDQVQHLVYEFGEFQLDARRGVLRSHDGGSLELTPKALGVLLHLVEHAGELVEKGQLFAAVWPNVVVEEGNLTQTIHVIRRALGEQPGDHRFIVTVTGRGYRFVANVKIRPELDSSATPPPLEAQTAPHSGQPLRIKLIAGVFLALGALAAGFLVMQRPSDPRPATSEPAHSIAVLPFLDMSPSGDNVYFADGLSEEVLNLLAQAPELKVIARTSSFSFRDRNVDIATIAQQLHVGHVLEGSVRKAGNRVRITAQLIETSNSSHVWSATYDRELDDVFAVQSEIAAAVAEALQSKLVSRSGPAAGGTESTDAYEQFLRGQFFYGRRAPGDLEKALSYYERALEIDARYARAWAGVAAVHFIQTVDGPVPREVGLPKLFDAARNAIEYDPELAEGHVRLAHYYWLMGEREKGRAQFARAAALNPNSPLVLGNQAGWAAQEGRYDEAIALARRVVSLDPLSAVYISNLGGYLFAAGQLEEAKAQRLRAQDLAPDTDYAAEVAQILVLQGKFDDALAFIERWPHVSVREQGLALVYHALGRASDADAALDKLIASSATSDPVSVAEVYAYRGDIDEAFKWLKVAADGGFVDRLPPTHQPWEMRASPLLAPLHTDPRWPAWLAASKLHD